MSKTISVSARVDARLFEKFKSVYLEEVKESFKDDTLPEIVTHLLNPSNSDLVNQAFILGLKQLEGQRKA